MMIILLLSIYLLWLVIYMLLKRIRVELIIDMSGII